MVYLPNNASVEIGTLEVETYMCLHEEVYVLIMKPIKMKYIYICIENKPYIYCTFSLDCDFPIVFQHT